jgi:hypothetical protein
MTKCRKKLTREQKKAIWSKPESNAGVGWHSDYENNTDPREYEEGRKPLEPTINLDKPR